MRAIRFNLSGKDHHDFLQRQLTVDMQSLSEKNYRLSAWCNIQGRVVALLWLKKTNAENTTAIVPAECWEKLMPRFKMFVLRDDVRFSEPEAIAAGIDSNGELQQSPLENSQSHAIDNGIPLLPSESYEAYLPQMLNLDCIGGLSFKKGCYPGQEIVARTHFRGKLKQRMLRISGNHNTGATLTNQQGEAAGKVISSDGQQALAVLRLERLDWPLKSATDSAELLPLPYAIPELS